MESNKSALTLVNISKSFGQHTVLSDISFDVAKGQTVALLGENGAGKSTLAKIIAGAAQADGGQVLVDGERVELHSPRSAISHGISFIPQELIYVPELLVSENVTLGRLPKRMGFTGSRLIMRQAIAEAAEFGIDLPLDKKMSELSLAQQQLVEILKALARKAKIIVLDEPTAALSAEDSKHLLELTGGLASRGVGIVYISHRLDEVFAHCQWVNVLRNGELVQSGLISETTPNQVVESMLGTVAENTTLNSISFARLSNALEVSNWNHTKLPILTDISFTVREGEVLGIFGTRGSGAETIAETLGGLRPEVTGSTKVASATVSTGNPRTIKRAGIEYVPADRKSQGLVLGLPILQAMSLPMLSRLSYWGIVNRTAERVAMSSLAERLVIRARSLRQKVGELSGGNQQKVLLGSRIATTPKVLVLHEPTRGVDVGARTEIHRLLRQQAESGVGQLVVTSDIEEAVSLCDRLLIIRNGQIVSEITSPDRSSQHEALSAAGGLA